MSTYHAKPRDASGFLKQAKKQLGQNFLHERGIIEKIILALSPQPDQRIVEIGPGQGALTLPILEKTGKLTAIEFDRDLIEPLGQAAAATGGELQLIHRDVLQVDFSALAKELGGKIRLIGNLPYNLSSPILFHALAHAEAIVDMHFMLQKEVVERMAASEGSKVYGRLSVMLQAFCQVTALLKVPPGAFRPAPKVDSAVVRLVPRAAAQIQVQDSTCFAHVVRAAFAQRRKTLHNALRDICDDATIRAAGLEPQMRAEQVPVTGFIALANQVSQASQTGLR
ncbi:16S rRNA (adenine(1518)-N(6)/adenine(1519)-N(6))-dimethyltransferase [Lysobacteraceae bacterium NML120232]|nr:16S rRNA (adenine(1518)-N(6)/adenine(1519)-N(6))-dimethyltransferase [Xanthomonadaceae bacterium NML08-0793]PJK12123.1 16S rRNA (adenine(1518)-N(6)/adenine(1519)-N(6))-dimethyltransferase [Xanthomonadaceae bacterium NML120232]